MAGDKRTNQTYTKQSEGKYQSYSQNFFGWVIPKADKIIFKNVLKQFYIC